MTKPNAAFFPRLVLRRSKQSQTGSILYSASTSSMLGRGTRVGLYVAPGWLPKPIPEAVSIMVYRDAPPEPREGRKMVALTLERVCAGSAVRYNDPLGVVGTVYLPEAVFGSTTPERCFLEFEFPGQ